MQHEKENEDLIILGPKLFKFGLSEKHTNFEKFFLMVLTNQLIYKIFSNYVCFSKSPNFIFQWNLDGIILAYGP